VTVNVLKEIFDSNGIVERKSLLLARYLVQPNNSSLQKEVVTLIEDMVGPYSLYTDQTVIK